VGHACHVIVIVEQRTHAQGRTTSESVMPRNAEPTWDSGRVKDLLSSTGGRADSDLRVTPPRPCRNLHACLSSSLSPCVASSTMPVRQMEKLRRQDQYAAELREQIAAKAMAAAQSRIRPTSRKQARRTCTSSCRLSLSAVAQEHDGHATCIAAQEQALAAGPSTNRLPAPTAVQSAWPRTAAPGPATEGGRIREQVERRKTEYRCV